MYRVVYEDDRSRIYTNGRWVLADYKGPRRGDQALLHSEDIKRFCRSNRPRGWSSRRLFLAIHEGEEEEPTVGQEGGGVVQQDDR